jgi:uncharacterized protein YndB with AHSA1/START domain
MTTTTTDRIEKKVLLRKPRGRVWRAISDAKEFGDWFGVAWDGTFRPGAKMKGKMTIPAHKDTPIEIVIDRVEPETLFSYRWHPYAVDPKVDYSAEPMTLVEFRLEEVPEGTMLTVTETGFDGIPASRRAEALKMNDNGWASQLRRIEEYLGRDV